MLIALTKLARANVPGQPNLKAYAAVKIGEITICDCRIIQQAGQKAYVTGPQKQVGSQFYPVVLMTTELREKVQAVVINAALQAGIVTAVQPALPDNSKHQAPDLLSALKGIPK